MTRSEALSMIRLLSAVESWAMSQQKTMPDYLHEQLHTALETLEAIVLGDNDDK